MEPVSKMRLPLHDVKRLRTWPAICLIPAETILRWFRDLVLDFSWGLLLMRD